MTNPQQKSVLAQHAAPLLLAMLALGAPQVAFAQATTSQPPVFSFSITIPSPQPPRLNPNPTPTPVAIPTPRPEIPVRPETPRIPIIPIIPQIPKTPQAPINPLDLTRQLQVPDEQVENPDALAGIRTLKAFPEDDKSSRDLLLCRATESTVFQKVSSYSANFENGELLAAMRKPSRLGFVTFPLGKIALTPDADILIRKIGDTYRIVNFDGRGESVKIKLSARSGADEDVKVIALAPGYEVIIGSRVLTRNDVRVADGCARRHFKMLENGTIAVCEISTESVLASSAVVAKLNSESADKERRILGDMSKMAAVLNYVNGTQGYKIEVPETQTARNGDNATASTSATTN